MEVVGQKQYGGMVVSESEWKDSRIKPEENEGTREGDEGKE